MAVIEVVKGGQKIENVVITTPQPMTPTGALPPDIGYVEIGTSEDRGSIWMTGQGPPTTDAGQAGDMYLDMDTGDVWQWNGTEWELQGTFAPSTDTPEEVLAKIITVDGPGSLLDADTLDGHDSTYFATASGLALAESDIDVLQAEVAAVATENDQQDIDISMKANIASPLFTGDPRAPTPATNDNDTSIATTAYVKANIATIPPNDWASIPGKPATFPPTVPIAQADVTNLVSDLALKAPLASPTFTGDPKAPTPATSDNDTSIATTAFVKAVTGAIVGGALISDTPPASPAVGQMWFESDSGNTYIWYADADSSQWVQVNIQPGSTSGSPADYIASTPADMYAGFRTGPDKFIVNSKKDLTGTDMLAVDKNGVATAAGNVVANSSILMGSTSQVILSPQTAGNVFLRPNGPLSSTGQFVIDTAGNLSGAGGGAFASGVSAGSMSMSVSGVLRYLLFSPQNFLQFDTGTGIFSWYNTNVLRTSILQSDGSLRNYGPAYKPGGGAWGDVSSDERVKDVTGPYTPGLAAVRALNPVQYRFRGNDTDEVPGWPKTPDGEQKTEAVTVPYPNSPHYQVATDGKLFTGLIAQEVEAVLPNVVTKRDGYIDGEPVTDLRGMDTSPLIFALINAVKELAAKVEALEAAP